MKHIWMIIAIMSLVAAVHRTVTLGIKEAYIFYIFVLIAVLMYSVRNYMGKKEKNSSK